MPKSSIMKMLEEIPPNDRIINKFPLPYNINWTIYKQLDFNEDIKYLCKNSWKLIQTHLKICKMIIVGDVSVGKTALVNRFCHKLFDTSYKCTIGVDFEIEKFHILQIPYNLQIWDTAGQERFKSIAQSYYRAANVIVLVFDFTSIDTLYNCKHWLKEALDASKNYKTPHIFLVGTKKDLISSSAYDNIESIAIDIGQKLQSEYWPVSSKTGENINELFWRIAGLSFNEIIMNEMDDWSRKIKIGDNSFITRKSKEKSTCKSCMQK